MTPDTVIRWQRKRLREHWARLSDKEHQGDQPVPDEAKELIRNISAMNWWLSAVPVTVQAPRRYERPPMPTMALIIIWRLMCNGNSALMIGGGPLRGASGFGSLRR